MTRDEYAARKAHGEFALDRNGNRPDPAKMVQTKAGQCAHRMATNSIDGSHRASVKSLSVDVFNDPIKCQAALLRSCGRHEEAGKLDGGSREAPKRQPSPEQAARIKANAAGAEYWRQQKQRINAQR